MVGATFLEHKIKPKATLQPKATLKGNALLEHVIHISRHMAETRGLTSLLSYAIDEVLRLVGAERGFIVLIKQDGSLDFRVKCDYQEDSSVYTDNQISLSILGDVVATGRSLLLSNAMTHVRYAQADSVQWLQLRSVMCVPLISQNETIGAIYVENRSVENMFRQCDLLPLELFANQAAVAIRNACLNDELETAHYYLHSLDEAKNSLILLISNELKKPVNSLCDYTDLIKDNPEPSLIRHLEMAVNDIVGTVNEIIDVFEIISDQLQLDRVSSSLSSLITIVVQQLQAEAGGRCPHIDVEDMSHLPKLMLDVKKIHHVFVNVIGNAIKYTPEQGCISIKSKVTSREVVIIVEDEGVGIAPDALVQLTDLLQFKKTFVDRLDNEDRFDGGGLGLLIAKGILDSHNGVIDIKSPGYDPVRLPGTTCSISLPIGAISVVA